MQKHQIALRRLAHAKNAYKAPPLSVVECVLMVEGIKNYKITTLNKFEYEISERIYNVSPVVR